MRFRVFFLDLMDLLLCWLPLTLPFSFDDDVSINRRPLWFWMLFVGIPTSPGLVLVGRDPDREGSMTESSLINGVVFGGSESLLLSTLAGLWFFTGLRIETAVGE